MKFLRNLFFLLSLIFFFNTSFALTTIITIELTSVSVPSWVSTWSDPRWGVDKLFPEGCNIQGWSYGYSIDNLMAEVVLLDSSLDVLGSTNLVAQSEFRRGPGRVFPILKGEKTSISFNKVPDQNYGLRLSLLPNRKINPTTINVIGDGVVNNDRIYDINCDLLSPGIKQDVLFVRCGSYAISGSGYVSGCSPSSIDDESRTWLAVNRNCSVQSGKYIRKTFYYADGTNELDPLYPQRFCFPLGTIS